MAALCQFRQGSFRSGQPKVHLLHFSISSALSMAAEKCRAIPMVLNRSDVAHMQLCRVVGLVSRIWSRPIPKPLHDFPVIEQVAAEPAQLHRAAIGQAGEACASG
jgi:hypothetical protein